MKIYRPSHILFGIIFFVGSYFAYSIYNASTIVLGIIIFIGIANIFYAFSSDHSSSANFPDSIHDFLYPISLTSNKVSASTKTVPYPSK